MSDPTAISEDVDPAPSSVEHKYFSHSRNPPSWLADYKTYFPRRMNLFLPRFILIRNLNLIKNQLLSLLEECYGRGT